MILQIHVNQPIVDDPISLVFILYPTKQMSNIIEDFINNEPVDPEVSYYVSLFFHLLLIVAVFVGTFDYILF